MPSYCLSFKNILKAVFLYVLLALVSAHLLLFSKSTTAESTGLYLLSKENPTYLKVVELTASLFKDNCNLSSCLKLTFKSLNSSFKAENVMFAISYGTMAANMILQREGTSPIIRTMLPRQIRLTDNNNSNRDILNLYIDQPLSRYFNLTKTIIPRVTRVGLLAHKSNATMEKQFQQTANDYNLVLTTVFIDDDRIGKALSSIIDDIEVLIALPDSRIHNSKTIPNILTTAYRNEIPVIGFSSAYTKAGAVASVYTSLDDIAKETAEAALEVVNNNRLPAQRTSSKYFSIAVNHEVANSLGLNISSEETIKNSMKLSAPE
jgi:ABC-type uncharacterized transport system substrate-binding protein